MVKKSKKSRRPKPPDLRLVIKDGVETRFFRRGPWVEHWINAILAHPLDKPGFVLVRLKTLLSGPDPVNGVQARHPSMDEEELFYALMCALKIPVTAHFVGALDKLILAAYPGRYACDHRPKRLSLEGAMHWYTEEDWEELQDGLGLLWEEPDDSMRIASCARLLAGGQRIREWCAGGGVDGEPPHEWRYSEYWLYKCGQPVGKQKFNELVGALDTQSQLTQSEWVKAIIAATKDHLWISHRDLGSGEVYSIIFEQTKPDWNVPDQGDIPFGADVGDEPPVE